jgi:VanZ family protein
VSIFKKKCDLKQFVIAYLPPVLWAGLIFILSSQTALPGFEQSAYDFILKKFAHIFVYLTLYFLVARAISITINKTYNKTTIFLPIFICLIYAVSDEFHQSLVPGRYATFRDIGYDMLGVTIAYLKKYSYI